MQVIVDFTDEELQEIIKRTILSSYCYQMDFIKKEEISNAVRDIIYNQKEELIEKCVDRASRELTKKGLSKFTERLLNDKE